MMSKTIKIKNKSIKLNRPFFLLFDLLTLFLSAELIFQNPFCCFETLYRNIPGCFVFLEIPHVFSAADLILTDSGIGARQTNDDPKQEKYSVVKPYKIEASHDKCGGNRAKGRANHGSMHFV